MLFTAYESVFIRRIRKIRVRAFQTETLLAFNKLPALPFLSLPKQAA
jgi:hypothetical protein